MDEVPWYEAVQLIEPYVLRISTPRGSGTGFLISHGRNTSICGIATAAHVIDQAHYWEEPIRFDHVNSGQSVLVRNHERAVFLDPNRDTAAILIMKGNLPLPVETFPLAPKDMFLRVGNEIGWLGFPAIPSASLCFFGGRLSAWLHEQGAYLVDGVTINGVSGGPAFHRSGVKESPVIIIGVVSAYIPNRAMGEALPGLSVIRGVGQFHELMPTFESIDQAKTKETPPAMPAPESDPEGKAAIPARHKS